MSALSEDAEWPCLEPTHNSKAATAQEELLPGTMVGQYRIDHLLGRGGCGAVYAAVQPEIGARVAVKVLESDRHHSGMLKRFVDEARAVNRIRHPNIIDVFAFGRLPDSRPYFVMEYLEGETLAALLERGSLGSESRPLLFQICQALEAAHREGIVHRDLKPENVWIARPKHDAPYAKILDFGIAKVLECMDAAGSTDAGVAIGTPHYMSPEQCRGDQVDHRTDIYAMGVLLYRIFCGCLPFDGTNARAVMNQHITASPPAPAMHRAMPESLEQLILRCLEKDPACRPQSVAQLGRELRLLLADEAKIATLPGSAKAVVVGRTRGATAARVHARGRVRLGAAGAGLALLIAGVGWLVYQTAWVLHDDSQKATALNRQAPLAASESARARAAIVPVPAGANEANGTAHHSAPSEGAGDGSQEAAERLRAPASRSTRTAGKRSAPRRGTRQQEGPTPFLTENPFR